MKFGVIIRPTPLFNKDKNRRNGDTPLSTTVFKQILFFLFSLLLSATYSTLNAAAEATDKTSPQQQATSQTELEEDARNVGAERSNVCSAAPVIVVTPSRFAVPISTVGSTV